SALRQLGVHAVSENRDGRPPVVIETEGMRGGHVRMRGDVSSQFVSGLLMAAPLARDAVTVELDGPVVSRPYVAMTIRMMRAFGAEVVHDRPYCYDVDQRPWYEGRTYDIEPDATSASYFLGAAAITGGAVAMDGLPVNGLQGDARFASCLDEMGCEVIVGPRAIKLQGRPLHGITADMNAISDT